MLLTHVFCDSPWSFAPTHGPDLVQICMSTGTCGQDSPPQHNLHIQLHISNSSYINHEIMSKMKTKSLKSTKIPMWRQFITNHPLLTLYSDSTAYQQHWWVWIFLVTVTAAKAGGGLWNTGLFSIRLKISELCKINSLPDGHNSNQTLQLSG